MDSTDPIPTLFAPAERATRETVEKQAATLQSAELLRVILDTCPSVTLVLNSDRQIVYYNHALLDLLNVDDPRVVLGLRQGEAVGCVHGNEHPGGCGTSEACQVCGAMLSILDAFAGKSATRECRITRSVGGRMECLDLAVSATPVTVEGERFVCMSLTDISHEKRRRALERIFFHDVLNTASCVQGLAELMAAYAPEGKLARSAASLCSVSRQLVDEILSQRTLAAAETDEIVVNPESLSTRALIEAEVERYSGFPVARERTLEIDPATVDVEIFSDRALLGRVLGNMLANALEASLPGQTVRIGCQEAGDHVEFWVANATAMPRSVQLQVFQRSFTTKGSGRGLGTYSMKLLTERYLGGSITFRSAEREGTEFRVRYPRVLAA